MTGKTMKQIADYVGCPKIKVYRYIKANHIKEAFTNGNTMYYDETVADEIISAIKAEGEDNETTQERSRTVQEHSETFIETLVKQLEIKDIQLAEKDKQIEQLTLALTSAQQSQQELANALQTAQALHAGTIQQGLIEDKQNKNGFFSKLFRRKEDDV